MALISGMADFAHLNDYILLATLNCKICSIYFTLEVLTDHLLIKAQSAVFYSSANLNLDKIIGARAGGARGAAAPPKIGQLRFFGQQEKIWAKPVFKDVSMFFIIIIILKR